MTGTKRLSHLCSHVDRIYWCCLMRPLLVRADELLCSQKVRPAVFSLATSCPVGFTNNLLQSNHPDWLSFKIPFVQFKSSLERKMVLRNRGAPVQKLYTFSRGPSRGTHGGCGHRPSSRFSSHSCLPSRCAINTFGFTLKLSSIWRKDLNLLWFNLGTLTVAAFIDH